MEIFSLVGKEVKQLASLKDIDKTKQTWIRVLDMNEDLLTELSSFATIPLDEFKEFFEYEEHSRLEQGRFLELVYQAPFTEKGEITTSPVNMFIINNLFITVEKEKNASLEKISSFLKTKKLKFLFKQSIGEFLYYFLDKINDQFLTTIDKIANLADILESREGDVSTQQLMKLYNYNVTLTHFNQAIMANVEVLIGLKKSYFKKFTKDDLELFSDLYYDKLHILDTEKIQREVISNLFNFQTVVSTHKLNHFMKRLTSLALVIMVPTFITSLFGMNVKLPFAGSEYGFFILLGIMIVIALFLLLIFKLTDWI